MLTDSEIELLCLKIYLSIGAAKESINYRTPKQRRIFQGLNNNFTRFAIA
jgi:hypothetical protein